MHAPAEHPSPVCDALTHAARPRRLLMTTDAVGGVWRYSIDLAKSLRRDGVCTTLVAMGPAPSPAQRREAGRAGVRLVDGPYPLEWMPGGVDTLQQSGRWLLTLAREIRPDVVHLNGYAHASLPWGAPVVVVAHSCVRTWWRAVKRDAAPAEYDRYTAAVLAGLQAASVVVAPSRAMLEALCEEYGTPRAACVIPNGCVTPPPRSSWQDKQPCVLAAGRVWDEAKNVAALCGSAGRVAWPVYVAGATGAPDHTPRSLPGVHALGAVTTAEMRRWYERAAIYALPARYEPFGLSVLEAARAGCALVLGDIPSLRENWDGAACFVAPDDHDGLAAAIQHLIDTPAARHELSERAARRARRFSLRRTTQAYRAVYEGVLA